VTVSERGTGQGAVISPSLANVYLHYALDLWAERWRRREGTGDMIIVRYADDFIVGFQHEADARRFLDTMRERLQEFALSLHPEKTWASSSSVVKLAGVNSGSNGSPDGIACG
jgi:RNA-directed DNA polymerase